MKKKKKIRSRRMKNTVKTVSKAALIAPLIVTSPTVSEASINLGQLEQWIQQQIGGYIHVGETVTLNLSNFFDGSEQFVISMLVNHNDAVVDVHIEGHLLTLSGKAKGSTVIDLLIETEEGTDIGGERIRVDVRWPDKLIDEHEDGLGLDDLVHYVRRNSQQSFQREDYVHLMEHIAPVIEPINRAPFASEYPMRHEVIAGEAITIDLNDVFFDVDGDQLEFEVVESDENVIAVIDGSKLTLTVQNIAQNSLVTVMARDGQSQPGPYSYKNFELFVKDAVPEALYEETAFLIKKGQQLEMDMMQMFIGQEGEDLHIFAFDEDGEQDTYFESETGYLLGIVHESGMLHVSPFSSDTQGASLNITFQASHELDTTQLSDPLQVNVEFYPISFEPVVVFENDEITLSEIFKDLLFPYTFDGVDYDDFSLKFAELPWWAELIDDDTILIVPQPEDTSDIVTIIATTKDEAIRIISNVSFVVRTKNDI